MAGEDDETIDGMFFGDVLSELERRRHLERTGRIAATIEIELKDGGPLGLYVASRRQEAGEALRVLTAIDPNDAVAIAIAQSTVTEYLRVTDWIRNRVEEAEIAEEIIRRDYQNERQDADE